MSFLIDANIISEVRKGNRCTPAVASWWANVAEDELWLSALALIEVTIGSHLGKDDIIRYEDVHARGRSARG